MWRRGRQGEEWEEEEEEEEKEEEEGEVVQRLTERQSDTERKVDRGEVECGCVDSAPVD